VQQKDCELQASRCYILQKEICNSHSRNDREDSENIQDNIQDFLRKIVDIPSYKIKDFVTVNIDRLERHMEQHKGSKDLSICQCKQESEEP
jgi:hypothetical protein